MCDLHSRNVPSREDSEIHGVQLCTRPGRSQNPRYSLLLVVTWVRPAPRRWRDGPYRRVSLSLPFPVAVAELTWWLAGRNLNLEGTPSDI